SLPTGSVYGLNVKIICFAACFALFALHAAINSERFSCKEALLGVGIVTAFAFWSVVSILNGQGKVDQILDQLKAMVSTIFIAWLSIFLIRRGMLRAELVIRVMVYGLFVVSLAKVALIGSALVLGFDPISIVQTIFGESS